MTQNTVKSSGHTMPTCVMAADRPAGMPDYRIG